MALHRIKSFKGEAPRIDPRSLNASQAQNATNCKLLSNALESWREPLKVANLTLTGPLKTLYRFGPIGGTQYWLAWAEDVNVARGAVAGDILERTYFTGTDFPRYTTNQLVAANKQNLLLYSEDFTNAAWTNTATVTSNTIAAPDGTTTGDTLNDNSAAAAQSSEQLYAITDGADVANKDFSVYLQPGTAAETTIEIAYTGGGTPKVKTAVITWSTKVITNGSIRKIGAGPWYRAMVSDTNNATSNTAVVCRVFPAGKTVANTGTAYAWGAQLSTLNTAGFYHKTTAARMDNPLVYPRLAYRLGLPVPTTAPTLTVIGAAGGSPKLRAYVYTLVSSIGDEGPPSAASAIVSVETGQSVEIRAMDDQPFGDYDVAAIRLYRIASGTAGAAYQLVVQIAMPAPSTTLQYTDAIADANLGAVLQTATYIQPPADMQGIIALPNGVMVGFSGNQICFSEPGVPYAWPVVYRQSSDSQVVGIAAYGTTVVVGTNEIPYLISATDPATASMDRASPTSVPCVAKRGMVATTLGVIYPTTNGFQAFGPGIARLISAPGYTKYEFEAFNPDTMHAVFQDGRYVAFYQLGYSGAIMTGGAIVLDLLTPGSEFTKLGIYRHAAYLQPETTKLYLINSADGNTNTVDEWEGGQTELYYTWKSKIFFDAPTRMTAAQVIGEYERTLSAAEIAALAAQRQSQIDYNNSVIAGDGGGMGGAGIGETGLAGGDLIEVSEAYTAPEGVVVRIYGDRTLVKEKTMSVSTPFRFKSSKKYREWEIEITGRRRVTDVGIASTVAELRQDP
jgi:hypothetical protein